MGMLDFAVPCRCHSLRSSRLSQRQHMLSQRHSPGGGEGHGELGAERRKRRAQPCCYFHGSVLDSAGDCSGLQSAGVLHVQRITPCFIAKLRRSSRSLPLGKHTQDASLPRPCLRFLRVPMQRRPREINQVPACATHDRSIYAKAWPSRWTGFFRRGASIICLRWRASCEPLFSSIIQSLRLQYIFMSPPAGLYQYVHYSTS